MTRSGGPDAPGSQGGVPRGAMVAGAVVLALVAGALRWHPPRAEVIYPDAAVYMSQARGYLEGKASIAPPWRRLPAGGPVYPALTALVTPLAGDVERAGVWVSRASGVALVLLVAGLALALGGPVAGAAAGLFTAVAPRLIHFSEVQLTEALFAALTVAALAWGVRAAAGRTRPWEEFALGAVLGSAALTRAVGLVTLPVTVAAVAVAGAALVREPPRVWFARALRVGASALLVVGAYQAYAWGHGWYTAFDTHLPPALRSAPGTEAGPVAPPEVADALGDTIAEGGGTLERQGRMFAILLPALVWLLVAVGLAWRLLRRRAAGRAPEMVLLGWFAAYLVLLAAFRTSLARYLLAAAPVIFVYAGCGVAAMSEGIAHALRRIAPARPAMVAGLLVAAGFGGVAAAQIHTVFEVPEGVYPPVRALAADVRRAVPLTEPVAVFAAHAYLPYYLHGYWAGLPVAPDALPGGPGRGAVGGSRVVVLESVHAPKWDPAWRAAVGAGTDAGPFHLVSQRYFPDQLNLITVFADAAPTTGVAPGETLLAEGRLAEARAAFLREGRDAAAGRADALRALALAPYLPENLEVAHARYAAVDAAEDAANGPRVAWARPPGVLYMGVGDIATAWNRAALALALNRPREALDHIAPWARHWKDDPRFAYLAGMALTAAGDRDRGLAALEVARAGLPDDLGVMVARANAMASAGRFADAAEAYQQVLARDPRNTGVWLNLAHARSDAGDLDGARAALKHARRLPLRPAEREYLDTLERVLAGGPQAARPDG